MTDLALENMLKSVDKRLKELLAGQSELMAMIRASRPDIWKDEKEKRHGNNRGSRGAYRRRSNAERLTM